MSPDAVLVVPAEGDPGGLLAPGSCSSYPPAVASWEEDDRKPGTMAWFPGFNHDYDAGPPWSGAVLALPLWWSGRLVPEGWDRARRVWWNAVDPDATARTVFGFVQPAEARQTAYMADALVRVGLASRVVLLDRIDGRLVERGRS